MLKTDEGLIDYYQYWIKKKYDVKFERTVWGSHITVCYGEEPLYKQYWNHQNKRWFDFSYTNEIHRKQWFFYINIKCVELERLRIKLGLPATPDCGFHITVGRVNKDYNNKKLCSNLYQSQLLTL
jgi:hypothetical protein